MTDLPITQWQWWDRNESGIWCSVCGAHLMAPHNFETEEEMHDYEPEHCDQCGAPDDIDEDAI